MVKRYSIVLLLFLMLSCKSKEEKMFFDFDSVEYYSLNKSKEEEMGKNNSKSIDNGIFDKIFFDDYPDKVNNNDIFYKTINSDGFSKFKLFRKDVEYLGNNIFLEKSSLKMFGYVYACAPQYRDILVFKKNKHISGIAKICLSCRQFYLISSKKEIQTEDFGTEEEYKALEKLFNRYKKG